MSSSVGQDVQSLLSIRVLQKCAFFDPNQLTTAYRLNIGFAKALILASPSRRCLERLR